MTTDRTKQTKLTKINNYVTDGDTVAAACKKVGVAPSQYYAWRKGYKTAKSGTTNASEFFIITNNADSARNLLQGLI